MNQSNLTGKVVIEYLRREEAAQYLRVSLSWLDHAAAKGLIPYHKFGNGRTAKVVYHIDDLRAFIKKRRVQI